MSVQQITDLHVHAGWDLSQIVLDATFMYMLERFWGRFYVLLIF